MPCLELPAVPVGRSVGLRVNFMRACMHALPLSVLQIDHFGTVLTPHIQHILPQFVHEPTPIAGRRQDKVVRLHGHQQ